MRKTFPTPFKVILISSFLFVLVGISTLVGIYLGQSGRVSLNGDGVVSKVPVVGPLVRDINKEQIDFSLFWDAWQTVNERYFGEKDDSKRLNGAISGMVASLQDPYTTYLEPVQDQLFKDGLQGSFGGIGAELTVKNNLVTIISALEGTPATKAGLRGQDIVWEVDGHKTTEMPFDEVVSKIRGEKGTSVELTIIREGVPEPFKVTLIRDIIVVKSVKTEEIGADKSILYLKVNQFGDDTTQLLQDALKKANSSGKKGIVLDLRNNPGGYLNGALEAIGLVLPLSPEKDNPVLRERVAVLERNKDGKEEKLKASKSPLVENIPLVVVVNSGSASASEIFAGAMKDYGRAKVVGTKTFGKGSVQDLVDLRNNGSIKVTIAKWFTPLGVGIDGIGIEPDVVVELPEGTEPSSQDPQVQKALEILKQ